MQQGAGAEAASIGSEGMIGASVVLGGDTSPHEVIVQVSGEAWRLSAGALRELLRRDKPVSQGLRVQARHTWRRTRLPLHPQARRPTLPSMADVH